MEFLASRSPRFHSLVVGRPIDLVIRGNVNTRVLRRHRISIDDLTQAAISVGGDTVADIEKAQLSPNGTIVVVLHSVSELRDQLRVLNTKLDQLLNR